MVTAKIRAKWNLPHRMEIFSLILIKAIAANGWIARSKNYPTTSAFHSYSTILKTNPTTRSRVDWASLFQK